MTIDVDDPADKALATMAEHQVRRLPVIEDQRLVGIVSQADVARAMPENKVGQVVEAISS